MWALHLSNQLGLEFLKDPNEYTVKFMQEMATHNIQDECYILTVLNFITNNKDKNNFDFAFGILCFSSSLDALSLAEKLLDLNEQQAKTIFELYKVSIPSNNFNKAYNAIVSSENYQQILAIYKIFSSKMLLPDDIYDHYLAKIKEAKSANQIEDILIEYQNYISDLIKLNSEIYSMSTEEFLKILEECPDLQSLELSKCYIELAILRSRKRKETKE